MGNVREAQRLLLEPKCRAAMLGIRTCASCARMFLISSLKDSGMRWNSWNMSPLDLHMLRKRRTLEIRVTQYIHSLQWIDEVQLWYEGK